jgi:superfamily II DNA helicase RecQ
VAKKKTKFDDAVAEMAERITRCFCAHGRVQCGIVYCLSRNDCEKVAAELQARAPSCSASTHDTRHAAASEAPAPVCRCFASLDQV